MTFDVFLHSEIAPCMIEDGCMICIPKQEKPLYLFGLCRGQSSLLDFEALASCCSSGVLAAFCAGANWYASRYLELVT